MSSCVIVQCTQGFVVSTDTIAFKQPKGDPGQMFGRVKGSSHKLFQITDDIVVAAVGDFTSYLAALNAAARLKLPTVKLVSELLDLAVAKAADSRLFVLWRDNGKVQLDACELGHIRRNQTGAVAYPNPLLTALFLRVHESPEGKAISTTGVLGSAALINGFNAMAASLSEELAPPFDTICFLSEGLFVVSGGVTKLPVADFW